MKDISQKLITMVIQGYPEMQFLLILDKHFKCYGNINRILIISFWHGPLSDMVISRNSG